MLVAHPTPVEAQAQAQAQAQALALGDGAMVVPHTPDGAMVVPHTPGQVQSQSAGLSASGVTSARGSLGISLAVSANADTARVKHRLKRASTAHPAAF